MKNFLTLVILLIVSSPSFSQKFIDVDKFVKENGIKTTQLPFHIDESRVGFLTKSFSWNDAKGISHGKVSFDENFKSVFITVEFSAEGFDDHELKLIRLLSDINVFYKDESVSYFYGKATNLDENECLDFVCKLTNTVKGECMIEFPKVDLKITGGYYQQFPAYE